MRRKLACASIKNHRKACEAHGGLHMVTMLASEHEHADCRASEPLQPQSPRLHTPDVHTIEVYLMV